MQPHGSGHDAYLYIHPRSTRDTDAFFRDAKYGELWVGRRYTLEEAKDRYQIETRKVIDLKDLLGDGTTTDERNRRLLLPSSFRCGTLELLKKGTISSWMDHRLDSTRGCSGVANRP